MKKIILLLWVLLLTQFTLTNADNLSDNSVIDNGYNNFIKSTDDFCSSVDWLLKTYSYDEKIAKDNFIKNNWEQLMDSIVEKWWKEISNQYCPYNLWESCYDVADTLYSWFKAIKSKDPKEKIDFITTKSIEAWCNFTKIWWWFVRDYLRKTDNIDYLIIEKNNQYQNLLKIENNKLNLIEAEYMCWIKTKQWLINNYTEIYNYKCITLKNQYISDFKQLETFDAYNQKYWVWLVKDIFWLNKTQEMNENIDNNSNFFCMWNLDERLTYLENKKKEIWCSYNTLNYLDKNWTKKDKNWAKTFRQYFNLIDKLPESKKKILANNAKENDDSLINILYKYTKLTYFKDSNISKNYPWCDSNDIVLWNWQTWSACNVWTNSSWKVWSYFQFWSNKSWYVEWYTSTWIAWGWNSEDNLFLNWNNDNLLRQWVCAKWRHIPSAKEWMDLCSYFKWSQCNYNQVSSTSEETKWYTDKEFVLQQKLVNTLKLPLGWIYEWKLDYDWSYWFYWSSSPYNNSTYLSYMFQFTNNVVDVTFQNRVRWYNVRCIKNL